MIGMESVVTRNVHPAVLALGAPSRIIRINSVAIKKMEFWILLGKLPI
jgi:acetyltransferase-like isoleucine patch superfamily enzyme